MIDVKTSYFIKKIPFRILLTLLSITLLTFSPTLGDNDSKAKGKTRNRLVHVVRFIDYKMVYISPGTFIMGTPSTEDRVKGYNSDDEPQHRVTITRGFYIGVMEVTQGQWRKVMEEDETLFEDCGDDCPIEGVSWDLVQEFIKKLNQIEKTRKYRLPTEAEWEYVCRAGSKDRFSFGNDEKALGEYGWYIGNSGKLTHPVGKKKPNAWGLYDMHGNVFEWCEDQCKWEKHHVITDTYKDGMKDPLCLTGSYRVIRGGCWGSDPHSVRSAVRLCDPHDMASNTVGFRLVMTE